MELTVVSHWSNTLVTPTGTLYSELHQKKPDPVPEQQNLQEQPHVSDFYRVAGKLPRLSGLLTNPVLWFAQVEAQFELANITVDQTKFNCVVSQLGMLVR